MEECTFQPNIESDFISSLPAKRKFKKFLVDQEIFQASVQYKTKQLHEELQSKISVTKKPFISKASKKIATEWRRKSFAD